MTKGKTARKIDGGLLVLMIMGLVTGAMYIILLLPMAGISVLGLAAAPADTWGLLTWFEVFWQPITACFYLTAAFMIWKRRAKAKTFAKIAIGCSVIEALVLNLGLLWATRRGIMSDGIFRNYVLYPFWRAAIFIGLSISVYMLVAHYFDNSRKPKEVLTE